MPTIGVDCEIILDTGGYFVKPGTYQMKQPRLRHATYRADGSLSYIDLGPGKRNWSMTILAINDLLTYAGTPTGLTGQQYRDALRNSYQNNISSSIAFIDPLNNGSVNVYFDSYEERLLNPHSQIISLTTGGSVGASYEITISLLES